MVLKLMKCLWLFILVSLVFSDQKKMKLKIIKVSNCDLTPKKWDPAPPMVTKVFTKKVSRSITKLTIEYNTTSTYGPVQLGSRSYQIRPNAAKDLIYKMEHVNCHSIMGLNLVNLMHFNFDKNCVLKKGFYKIDNIDPNNVNWLLRRTITASGRYAYDMEFSHVKGITSCITFIIDISL